jgi:hypothetical protein
MQICGNAPEQSLAAVHLASSARAPVLMSALTAMIAAKSIELLVMISLPLMLFEKVTLPEDGKAIAVNRERCDTASAAFMWTAPSLAAAQPKSFRRSRCSTIRDYESIDLNHMTSVICAT